MQRKLFREWCFVNNRLMLPLRITNSNEKSLEMFFFWQELVLVTCLCSSRNEAFEMRWELRTQTGYADYRRRRNTRLVVCEETRVTHTVETVNWYVFTVTAVVNSPATVSTVVKWRFIAGASQVIQPDYPGTTAVRVANVQSKSPKYLLFITTVAKTHSYR